MENSKKLELTLCGMLPYGLKVKTKFGITEVDRVDVKYKLIDTNPNIDEYANKTKFENCKPLLHSLDKLTDPILEGGLIPIVELLKIKHKSWWNVHSFDRYGKIETKETPNYSQAYFYLMATLSIDVWKNNLENEPYWVIEKLKEWHFNLYDLPKEMYIEKSEHNN